MNRIFEPRRGMLSALVATILVTALPAAAQATPSTASCNLQDLVMMVGCGVTFPDTAVGDTSTITVTLTGGPMSGSGGLVLTSGDTVYTLANDTCSGAHLANGATCTFDLVFTPNDDGNPATHPRAQAGLQVSEGMMPDGSIHVDASQHTGGGGGGGGAPSYSGTVAPASHDFGSATYGSNVSQTFTLTGTSTDPLAVTGVALSGTNAGDYTIASNTCSGATLNQNDTCTVGVTFAVPSASTASRASSASLDFQSNADTPIGVPLTGTVEHTAVHSGSIAAGAGSLTGVVAGSSATKTYTVTGTSADGLTLGASTLAGPDASDYTVAGDGCSGQTLSAGDTCDVTVSFAPGAASAARTTTAELDVASDASSGSITAPLDGTVVAQSRALEPGTRSLNLGSFSTTAGGATMLQGGFANTGNVPLRVTAATVSGDGAANFAITRDTCDGATVAPGANCQVALNFVATVAGPINVQVAVGGDASASFTLTGTVTGPAAPAPTTTAAPTTTTTPSGHDVLQLSKKDWAKEVENTPAQKVIDDKPIKLAPDDTTVVEPAANTLGVSVSGDEKSQVAVTAADSSVDVPGSTLEGLNEVPELKGKEQQPVVGTISRAVATKGRIALVGKTCKAGRCTVRLKLPSAPGVWAAIVSVTDADTGKTEHYRLATIVRPRLAVPKSVPACVTLGQGAATDAVTFGVSRGTRLTWSLAAARRQPARPRWCESNGNWPKLAASSKALAGGVVAGYGTQRTTSMAKILNKARMAKLQPGFYRVRFVATANGLIAKPASWWIQVLPREEIVGS